MNKFISIFINSTNSFEGQEEGENVLMVIRSHYLVLLNKIIVFIVLVILPPLCGSLFYSTLTNHHFISLFIFLSSLWYLFLWQAIFYQLTIYALTTWTITDRRIINSTQLGLFIRKTTEVRLSRVQDINIIVNGFIPTFFRFGDVQIQSAGTEGKLIFSRVPEPENVKEVINRAVVDLDIKRITNKE